MLDGGSLAGKAATELKEEADLTVEENELTNMSKLALSFVRLALHSGFFPTTLGYVRCFEPSTMHFDNANCLLIYRPLKTSAAPKQWRTQCTPVPAHAMNSSPYFSARSALQEPI